MLTAVVGVNWGDEGKGRMVDLLSRDYDIVVRYQGGNNAGHTVINHYGKFVLNLIPCGIFRNDVLNVIGTGMVVDIEHLAQEIMQLREQGIAVTPDNLKVSEKAVICLPCHVELDALEEDRMAKNAQGTTRKGIAPAYSDKYYRKSLRIGDLLKKDTLPRKTATLTGFKNVLLSGYKAPLMDEGETLEWLLKYGDIIAPFIANTEKVLDEALDNGKKIMLEAQLGTLRDLDFGIYPFTTSSNPLAAYGPIGAGLPGRKLDKAIGIVKAYSSSVGGGPLTVEMFGEEADRLRKAGEEFGAATGRPRRVGAFDVVASRYGVKMQGADTLVLTKLDVLSYMEEIPVCVAYEIDGVRTTDFPIGDDLDIAKPIYEYLPGFKTDITKCRTLKELPKAALDYVRYIEKAVGAPIEYISVGPHREDYIVV